MVRIYYTPLQYLWNTFSEQAMGRPGGKDDSGRWVGGEWSLVFFWCVTSWKLWTIDYIVAKKLPGQCCFDFYSRHWRKTWKAFWALRLTDNAFKTLLKICWMLLCTRGWQLGWKYWHCSADTPSSPQVQVDLILETLQTLMQHYRKQLSTPYDDFDNERF